MKKKENLPPPIHKAAFSICLTALLMCLCHACSSQEETAESELAEPTGTIAFTIQSSNGTGEGTNASPITVATGDTLNMTIEQHSSYTDPNGHTFSCEPKATIGLHAKSSLVRAKDFQSLLAMSDKAEVKTSTEGDYPVKQGIQQTFTIGGQEIVFDLAHEVYHIVNSRSQTIEMPYLQLHQAQFGNADAAETRSEGTPSAFIAAIAVRPLSPAETRATAIIDSTLYEVTLRFHLDLEGVHTPTEQKQSLVFAVSYIGVVEEEVELREPAAELTYIWNNGAAEVAPPFTFDTFKESLMTVRLAQTATYTNMFGRSTVCHPAAQVTLTATQDTAWAYSLDELQAADVSPVAEQQTTGEHPKTTSASYTFHLCGKAVTLSLSHESHYVLTDSLTHEPVQMPFVSFGKPVLKEIAAEEIPDATIPDKEGKLYRVTATFSLEVLKEGVTEPTSETVEFLVEYLGAVEAKLVRVTYKRDWEWVEPHDNMALFYYAKVHRTRHYSTGESYTDTFMDYGHMATMACGFPANNKEWNGMRYKSLSRKQTNIADSIWIKTGTDALFADEPLPEFIFEHFSYWTDSIAIWKKYINFGRYYDEQALTLANDVVIDGDIGTPIPENLKDRKPGWYTDKPGYCDLHRISFFGLERDLYLLTSDLADARYDQYLLLDGRMFTFLDKELRPDPVFSYKFEEIPGGWLSTHEMRMQYLGRNFYAAIIDTILLNPTDYVEQPIPDDWI